MSHDLEKNKILASILVAGIVAMLTGWIASEVTKVEPLEKPAIDIDTSAVESAAGGVAAPTGPEPILALLAKADAAKGETLAKACLACHTFGSGEPNKVGPNLYGIINNKKMHKEDFAYSDGMKTAATKDPHWTYQDLNQFLYKPSGYVPGTKMSFPGLKKTEDRADVIAYLRTLAGSPPALPGDAEIKAETPAPAAAKPADTKTGDPAKGEKATPPGSEAVGQKSTPGKEPAPAAAK
jgi:cytochrome c